MRYDDRLLTVLNQPASDRHDAAVRWRQLVDLIARAGSNSASPTVAQAIDEIRRDQHNVDEDLRSAAARAVAALPLPLALIEVFASDELTVGAPVIAAATLDRAQWRALLSVANPETRRFIETLHPEIGTEPAIAMDAPEPPESVAAAAPPMEAPLHLTDVVDEPLQKSESPVPARSLHDLVERIQRRRRLREQRQSTLRGGGDNAPVLFRWECGPSGEIAWVDGAARGPLIGRSIARTTESDGNRVDEEVVRSFSHRAPFRDAVLTVAGDGSVAGEWRISGVPAFEPADGRFAGYRGIALRELPASSMMSGNDFLSDPASLRELVHEIKTPLNAIIGFAEIIEGQYLGEANADYRQRAADIVSQGRILLAAIDDLDFAAKSRWSQPEEASQTRLGELVERIVPTLRESAAERGVSLDCSRPLAPLMANVDPELAERLLCRLILGVIEHAGEGEHVRLWIDGTRDQCRVTVSRPASLEGLTDEDLFGANASFANNQVSLRLVRGLARITGAELVSSPDSISLSLPRH